MSTTTIRSRTKAIVRLAIIGIGISFMLNAEGASIGAGVQAHKVARTFELRIYTLRDKAALDFLRDQILPRNLINYPAFGIEAHGFWINPKETGYKLYVLVSYAGDQDPKEVEHKWLSSKEFAENTRGFDPQSIMSVDVTYLRPTDSSPLK